MNKPISIIVAIAENFAIGKNNDLLCSLPGDLKRFKEITTGHKIIMGRNTWESLPKKPLPNRENIIITRNKNYMAEGATIVHSPEELIKLCDTNKENFIIGGAEIYNLFLPFTQKFYITHIKENFDADVFFPTIDFSRFNIEEKTEDKTTDSGICFNYITYTKN